MFEVIQDELKLFLRELHAHPALGFKESCTSSRVAGMLGALGIEIHRAIGETGLVGLLKGQRNKSGAHGSVYVLT